MSMTSPPVLLFQGDSITNAFRRPEEVNDAYQLGAGYAMIVASTLRADLPTLGLACVNRGISGNTAADLLERWDRDALALRPTVISLLVGINDALRPQAYCDAFPSRLRQLMEQTSERLPGVRWVICEPFACASDAVNDAALARVRVIQSAVREAARGHRFVPLQSVFDRAAERAPHAYWIYDGIHPTAAGHQLIARAWLEATSDLFPRDDS